MTNAPPPVGTLPAIQVDEVIAKICAYEFGLDARHCVLANQQLPIPPDAKLFVTIYDDGGPSFGQATILDTDETSDTYGMELQQTTIMHAVRVEVMGFIDAQGGNAAKAAKDRLAGALNGFYAQQQAGLYHIGIGRAQTPVDATDTEVTARLVKYLSRVNVTALHQTAKAPPAGADYFNEFNGATTPGTALPPEVAIQQ